MISMFYTIFLVFFHDSVAFGERKLLILQFIQAKVCRKRAPFLTFLEAMKKFVSNEKHGTIGTFTLTAERATVAKANDKR